MKRLFLLACATVVAAIVTMAILVERALNLRSVPVSITLVQSASNSGSHSQLTFWVTNHTAKVLCLTPWQVEIRQGTNWTKFQHRAPTAFISPHAVADVTIDFTTQQYQQPTNTWRLTVNVAEQLSGAPAFLQKLKYYPRWLRLRSNTNFTMLPNPFTKGSIWYGNPRKVRSEDISLR
jgi:hypothetical protein